MNNDFEIDCNSNNNSSKKNNSKINLNNMVFEFISKVNNEIYEKLSDIANRCNEFDNVKNTFFIDDEDCKIDTNVESTEGIENDNFFENYDTLEDNYPKVIIARMAEKIIGFISIYLIDESSAEICGFVLPEYRNNNIGNYLMEKFSNELEYFYISIPVAKDNKTAPNFLRTNGYYPSTTECSMVINTEKITDSLRNNNLDNNLMINTQDNISEKDYCLNNNITFNKTENENELIFEIFKDNNNIGSCHISLFESCGCIHNVEISEDFRGNGYGKLLLLYSLNHVKSLCDNIILHVTKQNIPAYNLYKTLGFITTGEVIYYDNL